MGKLAAILTLMTNLIFVHPAYANQQNETVDSLIIKAAEQMDENNLDLADATLERALRVNLERADTWHMLARLRFKQGKYEQAVSMARKSDGLPDASDTVRVSNSDLIAEARAQLGDIDPANTAVAQAPARERAEPLTIVINKPRATADEEPVAQQSTWSEPERITARVEPVIQDEYVEQYSPPFYSNDATYWNEPGSGRYSDEFTSSKQQRKLLKRRLKREEQHEKRLAKAQRKLAKQLQGQQQATRTVYYRSERDIKRARAVQRLDQWMRSNNGTYVQR